MGLTADLEAEALKAARDANETPNVRATALMLALGPVQEFPDLRRAASERHVSDLYDELKDKARAVMRQDHGLWVPDVQEAEACITRLKTRIRASAKVWIIHGGASVMWKDVILQVERAMGIKCVEFDDPGVKRVLVTDRVTNMAGTATVAIAIMSAEDAMRDGKLRARQNVIHEIGLAQGYLGLDRVIILREQGVEEFSNMAGILYIEFKQGEIEAALAKLRGALEDRLS